MAQTWHDLLFAHWPIDPAVMRLLVPPELPLDTFEGRCWLGIAPFHMSGIHARGLPALPGLSRFPELNVRTYVTFNDQPGVFFFSLDADHRAAVWAARKFYSLPYFKATMSATTKAHRVVYASRRDQGNAEFRGQYYPAGPVRLREAGTLDRWLTERYCLYAVKDDCVHRAEIHHPQWPLQDTAAEIETNTMASAAGITLPDSPPLLHFSRKLEVLIWPLHRVSAP
jgi:uncharacterized protein